MSANYAGIACIGFPQCNGLWVPVLHMAQGFSIFSDLSTNYQGGVLDNDVRVTIQYIHRLGAMVTVAYVLGLSAMIGCYAKERSLRLMALIVSFLVMMQFALGVMNVVYLLPLSVAVAHNGVAALLLAMLFSMQYLVSGRAMNARRD